MTDLDQIRIYANFLMKTHQYENAIFYSELLLTNNNTINTNNNNNLSNEDNLYQQLTDLLLFTEALYNNKQYYRVIDFIERKKLGSQYLTFRFLAAQSCVAVRDYIKAMHLLGFDYSQNINITKMSHFNGNKVTPQSQYSKNSYNISDIIHNKNNIYYNSFMMIYNKDEETLFGRSYKELESNCCLLLGEIYEHMENRDSSSAFYKLAVKANVRNFSALRKLYNGNMLTSVEARSFLNSLDYDSDNNVVNCVLRKTYFEMFNIDIVNNNKETKHDDNYGCQNITLVTNDNTLSSDNSHTVVIEHPYIRKFNEATQLFNNSRFKKCYQLTKSILKEEPHNVDCFLLHSAVLKELKLENELFRFASSLIEKYPEKKESWYSMGCYYLAIGRSLLSRQQFLKAIEIDKFFGYAWLAVGHTYSLENERDQALAAYCSASHAISESHIPILYIAVEYSLSKAMAVSLNYLEEAMKIGSSDPYCWHEKGFILFNNKNYQEALKCFLRAYDIHKDEHCSVIIFWEPLLNNIGQCYYKLNELDKSLFFFEKALGKRPKCPSTLSSLALVHTRQGDFSTAKDYLNKVLGLNRDNLFATSLLQVVTNLNCKQPINKLFEAVNLDTDVSKRLPQSSTSSSRIIVSGNSLFDNNSNRRHSAATECDSSSVRRQHAGNSENVNVNLSEEPMDYS